MYHIPTELRDDYLAVIPNHGPRTGYWNRQLDEATEFHIDRAMSRDAAGHLIVVASQHPLEDGVTPGPEFAARLDEGAELHDAAWAEGEPAEIYVPGSRHREGKQTDLVSLADAGTKYLTEERGVSTASAHGSDWVELFNKGGTVYSGADEAAGAATAFQINGRFRDMTMVVSPAQRERAMLHLLANGVMAEMVVPEELEATQAELYHNSGMARLLETYTRRIDPTWQGVLSLGALLRWRRQPSET